MGLIKELVIGFIAVLLAILLVFAVVWGWANFNLWRVSYAGRALEVEKTYKGKAMLAEAENAKKARVAAAQAEKDAAQLTADAIKIVGEAAKQYPEYRQQEFYLALGDALKEGKISQIIYLPTEAGLPITEAARAKQDSTAVE